MTTIAVTGATGAVGGAVAHLLGEAGLEQRLVVRSPDRAPQIPGAHVVQASYGDAEASDAALAGVDVLFMVSGAESAERLDQHRAFVDAAARAGVQHVVYTSFLGASPTAVFTLARDHWYTEEHIRASGMAYTFLRDSFYLDFLPMLAGEDGVIRGPAGQGRLGAVAREDVARVAAVVLQDPASDAGQTYELTGREALSIPEAIEVIREVTGRDLAYVDETVPEAYESRRVYDAPDWEVHAWVSTYTAIAQGELATVTDTVERLTGRPPLTLRELLSQQAG
ncbi:SDR family oxidoreductase [Sanguibacter inulinus]|uniref:SDR family oxidoreductase n=1 Tax=Sanguibacter inulinus TaxID=60922 RepID=A0A853EWD9_9MICO|nr:SDR family oxidoreductase [Sanguibacter inulinus]MBF0723626.1 SDR family oxidoreductase [Sanguibacter inulinus]NYS94771.1 SDR family oxidoreductase [Sanguibacter inulinus]